MFKIKKFISIISVIAVVAVTFNFFSSSISAVTTEQTRRVVTRHWGGSDSDLSGTSGYWGYPTFRLWYDGSLHTEESSSYYVAKTMTDSTTAAYCLEPGIGLNTGVDYSAENLSSYIDNINTSGYVNISKSGIERLISLALYYGYQGNLPLSASTNTTGKSWSDAAYYIATQAVIWEVICDCIHEDGTRVGEEYFSQHPGVTALPLSRVASMSIYNPQILDAYNYILSSIQGRTVKIPSFTTTNQDSAGTVVLKWEPTTAWYMLPYGLTDTNGILGNFDVQRIEGNVEYLVDGNTLQLASRVPLDGSSVLKFHSDNSELNGFCSSLVWQSLSDYNTEFDQWQAILECTGITSEEVNSYLKVISQPVTPGTISIYKTGDQFTSVIATSELDFEIQKPVFSEVGMAGAVYEVKAVSAINTPDGSVIKAGSVVGTITTDSEGHGSLSGLYPGKYSITETAAPVGYALDTESHIVELTYDFESSVVSNVNVNVSDNRFNTEITAAKEIEEVNDGFLYNSEDYREMMGNIVFGLFTAETITGYNGITLNEGTLVDVAVPVITDNSMIGNVTFRNSIPSGNYYVMELQTDSRLVLDDTKYDVSTSEDSDITVNINNGENIVNRLGRIDGIKVDAVNGNPLSGAQIGLYGTDNSDSPIIICETDENGYFEFENIPLGTYHVREVAAPSGYIISDEDIVVNLDSSNSLVSGLKIENRPYGSIQGQKLDSTSLEGLSGAIIGLYSSENTDVPLETCTTSDNGFYCFENLIWGTYIVKEISAPENYILNGNSIDVVVGAETVNISGCNIENSRAQGSIHGIKTDKNSGDVLAGAKIGLYVNLNDDPIEICYTDEYGEFDFVNLEWGTYYLKEIDAPFGYLLNNNPVTVTIDQSCINIEGIEIKDEKGFGKIQGYKSDGNGNPLQGAVFGIFSEDEEELIVHNAIEVVTSNEEGIFEFDNLEFGNYIIKELMAPEGYVLTNDLMRITVNSTEQIEIGFVNDTNTTYQNPGPSLTPTVTPEISEVPATGESNTKMIIGLTITGVSVLAMLCGFVISRQKE